MPRPFSSLLLSLLIASSASALTMEWTPIGNPGNAADSSGFGAVGYSYSIGTYEVTNAQYAEFLNAKAASDPFGLYNANMSSTYGGITRDGNPGSYSYIAVSGRELMPVNNVSFYDALRFANWMNNGQGNGDTETGAYTLLGGAPEPSNGATVARNPDATMFLTSENEWYKAAYYSALSTSYYGWPAGSDDQTTCASATSVPNHANCNFSHFSDVAAVGSYTGSSSPYGTFDQGGNLFEWTEGVGGGLTRALRGGSFSDNTVTLVSGFRDNAAASTESIYFGFRVASEIPEPGTGLLVIAGLLGLAGWRRARA